MTVELNNGVREMDNCADVVNAWRDKRNPDTAWAFARTFGLVGRYGGKIPREVSQLLFNALNDTRDELYLNVLGVYVSRAYDRVDSMKFYLAEGNADVVARIVNRVDDELTVLALLHAKDIVPDWMAQTTHMASAIVLAANCGKFEPFETLREQARDRARTFCGVVASVNQYVQASQRMYAIIGGAA